MVFDAKKKLKGTRTVITESLTKERYALYQRCIDKYGREKTWTLDGRIYCLTGNMINGREERIVVTRAEDLS